MNGNVREWIQDTAFSQGFRGQMGGDFTSGFNANPNFVFGLDPAFVSFQTPTIEASDVGFRFASPLPVCVGDFNTDGGVDGADIEAFFVTWQSGDSLADVNQDGGVDGSDVEFFFIRWEAGC